MYTTPTALGGRDFRRLFWSGLITGLGAQFTALALPLVVLATTGSAAKAGLLGSVAVGTMLVAALPAGAVADAFERRAVMVAGTTLTLLASTGIALLVLTQPTPSLAALLVLTAVQAAVSSVQGPAAAGLLVAVVPAERLGAATAAIQSRTAAARLAGPLLGGLLYGVAAWLPFVVQTLGVLVGLAVTLSLRVRSRPAATTAGWADLSTMTAGLRFVWRTPELRTLLLLFGCILNVGYGAAMLAAVATTADADPSGRLTGLMSALAGAGSLLGGLAATRLPVQQHVRRALLAVCWVTAGGLALLAVTPAVAFGGVFLAVMGAAAIGNVAFTTLLLRRTDPALLGRVSAAAGALSMVAQPAGPLVGGLLYEGVGPAAAFGLLALATLVGALLAVGSASLRRLDVAASPRPEPVLS